MTCHECHALPAVCDDCCVDCTVQFYIDNPDEWEWSVQNAKRWPWPAAREWQEAYRRISKHYEVTV